MSLTIKKGDTVIVRSGKDKGVKGKVILVQTSTDRLVVEGVNIKKRRQKSRKEGQKGQVLDKPAPIARSSASLFCEKCGKGVRFGVRGEGTKKIRICRSCGREI